jgi:hypothetical protein
MECEDAINRGAASAYTWHFEVPPPIFDPLMEPFCYYTVLSMQPFDIERSKYLVPYIMSPATSRTLRQSRPHQLARNWS